MTNVTITANEALVLNAICTDPESAIVDTGSTWADVQEVADNTGKTIKSVKGIIGSLVKRGFVHTENGGGESGKEPILCITEEGCQFMITAKKPAAKKPAAKKPAAKAAPTGTLVEQLEAQLSTMNSPRAALRKVAKGATCTEAEFVAAALQCKVLEKTAKAQWTKGRA